MVIYIGIQAWDFLLKNKRLPAIPAAGEQPQINFLPLEGGGLRWGCHLLYMNSRIPFLLFFNTPLKGQMGHITGVYTLPVCPIVPKLKSTLALLYKRRELMQKSVHAELACPERTRSVQSKGRSTHFFFPTLQNLRRVSTRGHSNPSISSLVIPERLYRESSLLPFPTLQNLRLVSTRGHTISNQLLSSTNNRSQPVRLEPVEGLNGYIFSKLCAVLS